MKATHKKKNNKGKKDETMNTRYIKEEEKDEGMTLDYKPSSPDTHNNYQVIDSDDEADTTETFWNTTTKPILTTTIPIFT